MNVMGVNEFLIDTLKNKFSKDTDTKFFLENKEFVSVLNILEENIEMVNELDFLADFKDIILGLDLNFNSSNEIIDLNRAKDLFKDQNILEFFKYLNAQSLCVVVEPNNNVYLDLDYASIKEVLGKNISSGALRAICLQDSVQKFMISNKNGEMLSDEIEKFREKIIIDCDFEKDETLFNYSLTAIDKLTVGIKAHSVLKR